ncbi:hypothetical protein TWF281_003682 [Arthrobotrys megalospora]
MFWDWHGRLSKNVRGHWIETILQEIERTNIVLGPGCGKQALILLAACKRARGDIALFLRLWDRKTLPCNVIEGCIKQFPFRPLNVIPLWTDDPTQLQLFLELGFTHSIWELTVRAIVVNSLPLAQIFLNHLGFSLNNPKDLLGYGNSTGRFFVYELLEVTTFHGIIAQVADVYLSNPRHQYEYMPEPPQMHETINWLIIQLTLSNPNITDYIIQVMKWSNPSLAQAELSTLAIDLISSFTPHMSGAPTFKIIWEEFRMIPSNKELVIGKLLELAVDPTGTKLWQETIWEDLQLDSDRASHLRLLMLLVQCGADVNRDISPTTHLRATFTRTHGLRIHDYMSPVDFAFFCKTPNAFLLLVENGADVSHFVPAVNSDGSLTIGPEFLQALQNRDLNRIQELWENRMRRLITETIDSRIGAAFEKGDIDLAVKLSCRPECPARCVKVFLEVAIRVPLALEEFKNNNGNYTQTSRNKYLRLLRTILETEVTPNHGFMALSDSEFHKFHDFYLQVIEEAVWQDDFELLDLLLDLFLEYEKQGNLKVCSSSGCRLSWGCSNPLFGAAGTSLECLKRLVSHGFDINKGSCMFTGHNDPAHASSGYTALASGLVCGNMDTLVFALQNGANIYGRCGKYQTAIEAAVNLGRLDAVALFLEIDTECHRIALRAAAETNHKYIAEFVRTWKPRSDTALGDNVTEHRPAAFPENIF